MVSTIVATRNADGEAQPPPDTETGTLKSIAAICAAPVTMQNRTWGRPSALLACMWSSRVSAWSPNATSPDGAETSAITQLLSGRERDPRRGVRLWTYGTPPLLSPTAGTVGRIGLLD